MFRRVRPPLNESPSEKEGKCDGAGSGADGKQLPSMKVPPKRKGNALAGFPISKTQAPQ